MLQKRQIALLVALAVLVLIVLGGISLAVFSTFASMTARPTTAASIAATSHTGIPTESSTRTIQPDPTDEIREYLRAWEPAMLAKMEAIDLEQQFWKRYGGSTDRSSELGIEYAVIMAAHRAAQEQVDALNPPEVLQAYQDLLVASLDHGTAAREHLLAFLVEHSTEELEPFSEQAEWEYKLLLQSCDELSRVLTAFGTEEDTATQQMCAGAEIDWAGLGTLIEEMIYSDWLTDWMRRCVALWDTADQTVWIDSCDLYTCPAWVRQDADEFVGAALELDEEFRSVDPPAGFRRSHRTRLTCLDLVEESNEFVLFYLKDPGSLSYLNLSAERLREYVACLDEYDEVRLLEDAD